MFPKSPASNETKPPARPASPVTRVQVVHHPRGIEKRDPPVGGVEKEVDPKRGDDETLEQTGGDPVEHSHCLESSFKREQDRGKLHPEYLPALPARLVFSVWIYISFHSEIYITSSLNFNF